MCVHDIEINDKTFTVWNKWQNIRSFKRKISSFQSRQDSADRVINFTRRDLHGIYSTTQAKSTKRLTGSICCVSSTHPCSMQLLVCTSLGIKTSDSQHPGCLYYSIHKTSHWQCSIKCLTFQLKITTDNSTEETFFLSILWRWKISGRFGWGRTPHFSPVYAKQQISLALSELEWTVFASWCYLPYVC